MCNREDKYGNMYNLSESHAVNNACNKYQINSKLVCYCILSLKKLDQHNMVQLIQAKGNWREWKCQSDGEKVSEYHLQDLNWIVTSWKDNLSEPPRNGSTADTETPGKKNANDFFHNPSAKRTRVLKLNRNYVRQVAGQLTGHCH